jgi:hypothetical protein
MRGCCLYRYCTSTLYARYYYIHQCTSRQGYPIPCTQVGQGTVPRALRARARRASGHRSTPEAHALAMTRAHARDRDGRGGTALGGTPGGRAVPSRLLLTSCLHGQDEGAVSARMCPACARSPSRSRSSQKRQLVAVPAHSLRPQMGAYSQRAKAVLLAAMLLLTTPVASSSANNASLSEGVDQKFQWVLAYKQSSPSPVGESEGMDEATVQAAWASCNVHFAAIKYEIKGKLHSIYRRMHGPDGDFHKASGDRQGNPGGVTTWEKEGAKFSAFELMTGCWRSKQTSGAPNTLNADFQMFSTEQAYFDRSSTPGWTFCNYDDCGGNMVGFPRDCGPAGETPYQWHQFVSCPPSLAASPTTPSTHSHLIPSSLYADGRPCTEWAEGRRVLREHLRRLDATDNRAGRPDGRWLVARVPHSPRWAGIFRRRRCVRGETKGRAS